MALTVPSENDFLLFLNLEEWPDEDAERYAPVVLQQATDLMTVATGLRSDPGDATDARIMDWGIMAMAQSLQVRSMDRNREYSPFASERLGSYSYQKAAAAAARGEATGVDLFDAAVRHLLGNQADAPDAGVSLSSEEVFHLGETRYRQQLAPTPLVVMPDPGIAIPPE